MNFINTVFGIPLGYLMHLLYTVTANYAAAIILFTLISKAVMFPLNIMSQRNAVRMAKIKPKLDDIKRYYSGDKARIDEEQMKLYRSEKYNPFASLLPLILQIIIIIGLINVLYNPLQHLLSIPKDTINQLVSKAAELSDTDKLGIGEQLLTVDAIQNPANIEAFESLGVSGEVLAKIQDMDLRFWGMNLGARPSFAWSLLLLIPILAALSTFIMCYVQSKVHALQREQSAAYNWGMTAFFTGFSLYFPFVVPAGVGLYWIFGNLFAIPVMLLLNVIHNPKKYIDYSSRPKPQPIDKAALKANRAREKSDIKRFESAGKKRLVFYSAKSGFYKYFKNVIEYVLENSKIKIHYITNDPDDAVFKLDNPRLIPYYIGEKALISFMLRLDADMVVMTAPDLHRYHIKRSMVRKDIEYVYMFHGVGSLFTLREGALDYYDTILCVGQHQIDEIRATEKKYKLPQKNLIPCGYGLIDNLTADYEAMEKTPDGVKKILIAPSWQRDNIMETCLDELLGRLLGRGWRIVVRPHPEFVKRFPEKMNAVLDKYRDMLDNDFIIETDFSSNVTIFTADLLISDWSGIAFEYSYSTKRPCLLINTPIKIMNPNYKRIKLTPVDISFRDKMGVSVDLDKMDGIADTAENLFANAEAYRECITELMSKNMFCIGHSGETGGRYIIQALQSKATNFSANRPDMNIAYKGG